MTFLGLLQAWLLAYAWAQLEGRQHEALMAIYNDSSELRMRESAIEVAHASFLRVSVFQIATKSIALALPDSNHAKVNT